MSPEETGALRTARALIDLGHPLEVILGNALIPPEFREFVRLQLEREQNFTLSPARAIVADRSRRDWLRDLDRSAWHYWPALRQYLISSKGWESPAFRSLDDSSDRVLRQLESLPVLLRVADNTNSPQVALSKTPNPLNHKLAQVGLGLRRGLDSRGGGILVRIFLHRLGDPSKIGKVRAKEICASLDNEES